MILKLFPRGLAWPKEPGTVSFKFAEALADEALRVSEAALKIREEADPRTAYDSLEDFEAMVGLPDECSVEGQTISERREAVIARMTLQGSLSKQFYIDLALNLGFTVKVNNFRQFRAGFARAGDPISNGNWIYTWQVVGPADVSKYFRAGQGEAGQPLRVVGNQLLECTITKNKPAPTIVIFSYSG